MPVERQNLAQSLRVSGNWKRAKQCQKGSRRKWEAGLVEWCLSGYDVFVFEEVDFKSKAERKFCLWGRWGKKKKVASWTAVTGILLSYIKICLASANLKLPGFSTRQPWPAETDVGLLNSKDCSCLGILKLTNICTRYLYKSCVLRARFLWEAAKNLDLHVRKEKLNET